ncbi:MAG: DUF1801 domain-containing protein [Bacteroidia bacterium]|nr:DUF1801 domain-containing protein [Bacteroidia bacterium]
MNEQITAYINNAPKEQKEVMEAIRSLIHQSVKNVKEEFKWSRPIFKSSKDFAYLQSNKNHVNLGFYKDFEKLNDPKGLLEGTGKTMRHIKLKNASDIDHKLLSQWFTVLTQE